MEPSLQMALSYSVKDRLMRIVVQASPVHVGAPDGDIVREAPDKIYICSFGHCPFGGGGLNPCPDGLWHLFLGEMS